MFEKKAFIEVVGGQEENSKEQPQIEEGMNIKNRTYEPIYIEIKDGVRLGFKFAAGFWLFSLFLAIVTLIFWVVIGRILFYKLFGS